MPLRGGKRTRAERCDCYRLIGFRRILFTMSSVGPLLTFPLYFQQVLGATPMKAGMLLVSQAVGAAVSSSVIGRIADRRGPRGVVLVGTVVSAAALGVSIWAISQPHVATAVLMIALAVTGVDASAVTIPVASAAVHTLNDRDVAHASTLLHVNHQIAAAIGISQCSALLASLSMLGAVLFAVFGVGGLACSRGGVGFGFAGLVGGRAGPRWPRTARCVPTTKAASPRCRLRRRGRWPRRLNIAPQPTSMTPALALERSLATQISSNLRGWVWC